ncbi:MAG: metal ABC transporter ATP-binding protein [Oscillospiraceae bacterium]|jgi:zinc transport system ATP-binding protein|nr:metal ABC transporter ATP-binding protein [Oscillospiraceae bacterium]
MITAQGLYFSYTNSPPYALAGIELSINAGEYISVVGDNGSGKSTLMRLILGLLRPTRGTVETRAERIGYVPQRSDYARRDFPLTVGEMLRSYARIIKADAKAETAGVLALTGMQGHERSLVGDLSGGESQRTRLARALIGSPELLIFDEPSTGIDRGSQEEIYGLLRRLNRERGITIVSVEHNLTAAMANSTLIYHLHGGHGHSCTPEQYAEEFLKPGLKS